MILKVFTTKREIREFLKSRENTFLPKLTTIGELLEKAVVVDGATKVDSDLRKIFLFKALENVDISKIGFKKEFLDFFKNSEFIFSFFNEIFMEGVSIADIMAKDVYAEYEEHLFVLEKLYFEYKNILKQHSLYDKITIEDYRINEGYFEGVEKAEIKLSGYLPKFDLGVLEKLPCDVVVNFRVTPYNRRLVRKMFGEFKDGEYEYDLKNKKILSYKNLPKPAKIKVEHFSKRSEQVGFIFAGIEEFVNEGIKPEEIAVILPDESYSEYIKLLDIHNNLNLAMGESFVKSDIYILLKAVFEYISENSKTAYMKAGEKIEEFLKLETLDEVLEFVLKHASMKERKLLDEEVYRISQIKELKSYPKEEILHFLLKRFENLSFDDVKGGKITVMGVLESRGMSYKGAIIVDFNDEYVPNVSEKDYFLNSAVRKKASLPTRADKESLQKNYYYNIMLNAEKVKISYVKNEEKEPSRFLYELNLPFGENMDEFYSPAIYSVKEPSFYEYSTSFEKPDILTPTKLKTLLECPMKYYFSYVLNIKNDEKKEYFGNSLHNALQYALKTVPSTKEEYFDRIMEYLLKPAGKKEKFEILSQWEDKIKKFVDIDFGHLNGNIVCEAPLKSRKYKSYTLQARADRVIDNRIYDYKTSSKQDYLKNPIQAMFYKYLMPDAEVYYWDLYRVELIKVDVTDKELEKKIDEVELFTKRTQENICEYCDYRFSCLHS